MAFSHNGCGSSRQREEVERVCEQAVSAFCKTFGEGGPEVGAYAPGRVNLMGGSIDYSGGPVIPVVGLLAGEEDEKRGGGR